MLLRRAEYFLYIFGSLMVHAAFRDAQWLDPRKLKLLHMSAHKPNAMSGRNL